MPHQSGSMEFIVVMDNRCELLGQPNRLIVVQAVVRDRLKGPPAAADDDHTIQQYATVPPFSIAASICGVSNPVCPGAL